MKQGKNALLASGILLLFVAWGIFCGSYFMRHPQRTTELGNAIVNVLFPSPEAVLDKEAARIVSRMDYRDKLGQMVMIGVHGTELNQDMVFMLSRYHIGGVILFDRNLQSRSQVEKLTVDLQRVAQSEAHQPVPLFIGIDEEGGTVVRGKTFIEPPPAQSLVAQGGNPLVAEEWAKKTGGVLRSMGINVNFAPVADVGTSSPRFYSGDAAVVERFVLAAARGYGSAHEIFALKHFPGIGRGTVDSHQDVSMVDVSVDMLRQTDLRPFKAVIDQNLGQDYFVMVSHLKYPRLDPEHSASLSHKIITGLLRQDMGYDGLVITDDMEMGAVAKYGSFRNLGVTAVKAGADIVMICHEYNHQAEIYNGLVEAYNAGELDPNQIDASVRRIVKAKLRSQLAQS